jgi:molecular chaperone DnaJ
VNEAYEVLKDDQKKAAYDRFGHAAFEGGMGGGGAPAAMAGSRAISPAPSRTCSKTCSAISWAGAAGVAVAARAPSAAPTCATTCGSRWKRPIPGSQKTISVPTSVTCDTCHGTGAEGGAEPVTCPTCNGMGKVRAQQGFFTIERTCPTCNGMGQIIKNPCKTCGGQGRVQKEKQLSVNIPQGVETGTRIRLAGEGEAGLRGGPNGDLYIFIEVKEHAIFQRDGVHLFCRVPVSRCRPPRWAARSRCRRSTAARRG